MWRSDGNCIPAATRRGLPPGIEAMQTSRDSLAHRLIDLARGRAAADVLVLLGAPQGLPGRSILIHDVDVGVGRQFLGQEVHDLTCPGQAIGHHKMSHQQATQRQPVLVDDQIPYLSMHGANHLPRSLGCPWCCELAGI